MINLFVTYITNNVRMVVNLLDDLISKITQDECIIFIGDLIYQGTAIPTRTRIAQELASLFECPENTDYLPRVAQFYADILGTNNLISKLQRIIQSSHYSPLGIHTQLAKLPVSVVATTNYDDLLELAHMPGTYVSVTTDNEAAYSTMDRRLIIRLHGKIDIPGTLVITEEDHYHFIKKLALIGDILRAYITLRTPIFLGCDLEDRILKQFYLDVSLGLGKHTRRAYAIQADVPDHMVRYWQKQNLTYIRMKPEVFLQEIIDRIGQKSQHYIFTQQLGTWQPSKEPFKFLSYFDETDADIFFGRSDDAQRLLDKIAYNQLVILYSQSGMGKTSLIKAGLTPALRVHGYIPIYMRAWRNPIDELRAVLFAEASISREYQRLMRQGYPLIEVLEKMSEYGYKVVIFLDQFEEFFLSTNISETQRKEFVEFLREAAKTSPNTHFILSMREDFLGETHDIQQKIQTNYANLYRLRPLTRSQAADAITRPLNLSGALIDNDLLQHILDELSDAKSNIYPPQLQIICYKLYTNVGLNRKTIGVQDIQVLGGIRLILANYVNEVLLSFSTTKKEVAKAVLKALVTSHKTKTKLDQFGLLKRLSRYGPDTDIQEILKLLEDHRLLRKEEEEGTYFYELTHEYIIGKINEWISEEEFVTRRAQELTDQEFYNWTVDSTSYMGRERFALIYEQRENIQINDEQKLFLLMTAIHLSMELEYWLRQIGSPSESVLARLLEAMDTSSNQMKRNTAVSLAYLTNEGVVLDKCLQVLAKVGNPNTLSLLRALSLPASFVQDAKHVISRRFAERMVQVPYGPFIMGSTPDEINWVAEHFDIPRGWIEKEMPQLSIDVDTFYMDIYPVTNEEFQEFDLTYRFPAGKESHPAVNVDWKTARQYAAWIGKQLPTEAEWEKASRGIDGRRFPWGNGYDPKKANSKESGKGTTTPVGSYPDGVSPYGCYDMAGNVFEWTSSLVKPYPYKMDDGREDPDAPGVRIMRGGAFSYNYSLLRCALRYDYYASTHSSSSLGFRCVIRETIENYSIL